MVENLYIWINRERSRSDVLMGIYVRTPSQITWLMLYCLWYGLHIRKVHHPRGLSALPMFAPPPSVKNTPAETFLTSLFNISGIKRLRKARVTAHSGLNSELLDQYSAQLSQYTVITLLFWHSSVFSGLIFCFIFCVVMMAMSINSLPGIYISPLEYIQAHEMFYQLHLLIKVLPELSDLLP